MVQPHRSGSMTRTLVAEAVVAHVAEYGIGVVPDLPMERILDRAGVSRASAYRIWPGKAAFTAFALEQCAAGHAMGTLEHVRALELAREAVESHADPVLSAACFISLTADEELTILLASQQWRAFTYFQALATTAPTAELSAMLAQLEADDLDRLSGVYAVVAEAWELTPVAGTSIRQVASAALLISRSTLVRTIAPDESNSQARETYISALAALIRGSFTSEQGSQVDLSRLQRVIEGAAGGTATS